MCTPLIGLVVNIVASVGSAVSSIISTEAQRTAAEKNRKSQQQAAQNAMGADFQRIQQQAEQENDQAQLQSLQRMRQGLQERAQMRTASGESGLMGAGPARADVVSTDNQNLDLSVVDTNLQNKMGQNMADQQKVYTDYVGRYNMAENSNPLPSMWGAGLQIGSSLGSNITGADNTYIKETDGQ